MLFRVKTAPFLNSTYVVSTEPYKVMFTRQGTIQMNPIPAKLKKVCMLSFICSVYEQNCDDYAMGVACNPTTVITVLELNTA